eukprot:COSAG05_NODE_7041_length_863_cov_1.570681_1_plen_31_part_10
MISVDDGKEHGQKFREIMENLLVPGSTTEIL